MMGVSQLGWAMMMGVVRVVRMYIQEERNLCWFCSRTRILKTNQSRYVIVGPLQVPPTQLLTTLSTGYCPKESVCDFVLRRMFYSRQLF